MTKFTDEDIKKSILIRKESEKFHAWRKRINKILPEIANRVFALRGKSYMGHGFHYDMEHNLGKVILLINDYNRRFDILDRSICRIETFMLFKELKRAERSVNSED